MHCKADFYSQTHEGDDYSPENLVLDDGDMGVGGERRRSERGRKREKPDYYDSLEFENKVHNTLYLQFIVYFCYAMITI